MSGVSISRAWCMPSRDTFSIKPIESFIHEQFDWGDKSRITIDPFARGSRIAKITNDLNPEYRTDYHVDALDFLRMFGEHTVDAVLYDPPYSPRQIKECYDGVGYKPTGNYTQESFWGDHKKEIARIVKPGGTVLSFGWNTNGIGKGRGFYIDRILLVAHGGMHNDTICVSERKHGEGK